MVGADDIGFHHGALLARQKGGGGLLLEADAPGLAAGLVLEARAHHAEVQLVPLSGRAGKPRAGGTERPGDLGVGHNGLFMPRHQRGRLLLHNLGVRLPGRHAQRSRDNMGAARPAEGGLDGLQGGAVRLAGDLLEVEASGHSGRLLILPGRHADGVAVDGVEGEGHILVDTIPLRPVPVRPADHGALDGVCGDGQIAVGLAAEGGRYAALLHTEGISALVVQYLHRIFRRKEVLVVPGRQSAALFYLEQRPLAAALTAAADTHGDGGDRRSHAIRHLDHAVAPGGHPAVRPQRGRHMAGHLGIVAVYPRACCSSAALSIGGRSLPRRSARRKIP